MPRNRLIFTVLAFVLVAGACGGDDSDPADPVEDARPDTASAEAEPQQDAGREASATSEAEQRQDAPSGTTTTSQAEPQEAAVANPEAEPVQVRLGDRFEWCADVQAVWDAFDGARAELAAAEARHQEAGDAAEEDLRLAQDAYGAAEARAVSELSEAYRLYLGEADSGEDTFSAAFARAWEALIDSSPQVREAAAGFENADMDEAQIEAHRRDTEEVFQRVRDLRDFHSSKVYGDFADSAREFSRGAINIAERAGVSSVDIAALRDAMRAGLDEYMNVVIRRLAASEAEESVQAGVTQNAAEAADAAQVAENAAIRAGKTLLHNTREAAAAKRDAADAADAADAEAALAAATRAVDHLLAALDAEDALENGAIAAEEAFNDASAAQQSPQSVLDAARDAFTTSIKEALSDADAYAAFREPIQESCQ